MLKNILNILLLVSVTLLINSCSNNSQIINQPGISNQSEPTTTRAPLTDNEFWTGGPTTIWDRLQHVPLHTLESSAAMPDPNRAAWIKLAIISKRYNNDPKQLAEQLQIWRNENPSHMANNLINTNSTLKNISNSSMPKHIALLLPLQGQLSTSGQAVRDGFLNAYYQSLAKTHVQQIISFYDTSENPNIAALYQRAILEGADMIVGPLTKEDVELLLNNGKFSVPTLALNYTEGSLPTNFYEFGLSPIDEVQQVADKAWQDRHARAIIIAPKNAWGQRVSSKLITRWKTLGGSVSDTYLYPSNADFNQSIATLLHVNSNAARSKLQKDNNKTALEKERRQDFDVIFLLAEPKPAREIVPLLRFYYADNIPVYATSSVYSGSPDPQKDSDLNGVHFADIPWVFKSTSANKNRLYAVGRDAYMISNQLPRLIQLPNFPVYAATGALTLTSTHQIYRRLPWTQIRNGHP